ncbi:uncharacterized protein DNG_02541 [Cephalotrichum gorgonifer]|uniref:Uncharacterized protein n=1 Tax=Cephalotrichum gorgonifer TaxID=2041049 RepID=A0AAE8MV20_9PEZI|nr:uncharacterized protein DNG_02541 [Cephalotrichum gorgonifer]
MTWMHLARAALLLPQIKKTLAGFTKPWDQPDSAPSLHVIGALDILSVFVAMGYANVVDKTTTESLSNIVQNILVEVSAAREPIHNFTFTRIMSIRILFCLIVGFLRPDGKADEWVLRLPTSPTRLSIVSDSLPREATHLLYVVLAIRSLSSESRPEHYVHPQDRVIRPHWVPYTSKVNLADDDTPPPLPDGPHPIERAFTHSTYPWNEWYRHRSASLIADLQSGTWRGAVTYYESPQHSAVHDVINDVRFVRRPSDGDMEVLFEWGDGSGGHSSYRATLDLEVGEVRVLDGDGDVFRLFVTPFGFVGCDSPGGREAAREFYWFYREEWCL